MRSKLLSVLLSIYLLSASSSSQGLLLRGVSKSATAAGNTAPTLISYTESAWNSAATSKTVTVSWQTNDVIVSIAASEGTAANDVLPVPTASGLTFVSQKANNPGSGANTTCGTQLAAVVAGSSGTNVVITATNTGTGNATDHWGFGVWVYRNSTGIGNSAEQHTATLTVPLTPTAADGAIVWGAFDFSASAVTNWNATPPATNVRQRIQDTTGGTHYTLYVSDLADQVSSGSVGYGLAGSGAGSGPYSIVALEVKHQ